ncbi:unnamed protein product, partial [Urochloa humidicola]
PEAVEELEGEAGDEVRLGGGVSDVLAERRGLAPQAPGPRPLHGRGRAAAAAGGVAPRQQRARLLNGGPHCDSAEGDDGDGDLVLRFEFAFGRARGRPGSASARTTRDASRAYALGVRREHNTWRALVLCLLPASGTRILALLGRQHAAEG